MVNVMYKISGGASEGECYEEYGIRCNLSEYRKIRNDVVSKLKKKEREDLQNYLKEKRRMRLSSKKIWRKKQEKKQEQN